MANKIARLMTLHALTPLHAGAGQSTGIVDLPVQREVHTQFPMVAASGVKGSLRDLAEHLWDPANKQTNRGEEEVSVLFGPETGAEGAGALSVTDLRVLAFPVRSLQEVFVWVTCPLVLQRLVRDMALTGADRPALLPMNLTGSTAVAGANFGTPDRSGADRGTLVLEELVLELKADEPLHTAVTELVGHLCAEDIRPELERKLVLVADEAFSHFVQHCTQVSARIALNDRKTTDGEGNLWYEETLPPETLLYGLVLASEQRLEHKGWQSGRTAETVDALFAELFAERPYLQIGGNETVGCGWCRVQLTKAGE